MDDISDVYTELKKQTAIFQNMFESNLYSHAPFASLLMSEVNSYEDMDGNDLLFCIDFIFDVPYEHLSPMIQSICEMYWRSNTQEDYEHFRLHPKGLKLLSFEDYRDGIPNSVLRDRVTKYIDSYKRVLAKDE